MSGFTADHKGAVVRPSPNFGERKGANRPDMIVLHYTSMASAQAAEEWLCDPRSQVSSHYLVHEDGRIVQMVREADRAWHAGKSSWHGESDVNSCSVGIEMVNPGHEFGYRDFPDAQIAAVIALCRGIIKRHDIVAARVLGHSDVAPGRKVDPGERFPWRRLHEAGIGLWTEPARLIGGKVLRTGDQSAAALRLQGLLADFGYKIEQSGQIDRQTEAVISAFQQHFRQQRVDGRADRSTIKTLRNLLASRID